MKQLIYIWLLLPTICIAQITPELSNALHAELKKAVVENQIEGISAALNMPNGDVWKSSYGLATPSDSLTTDHHLFAGSTTKTFIAALILQMQEDGLLTLDDSIGNYLGPFENVDNSITIEQLLNHTSGIYNYTDNTDIWGIINSNPTKEYTPVEIMEFVKEPLFEAGASWSYSNTNYILLSIIIEAINQERLKDVLRTQLIDPLGLKTMFLAGGENPIGPYGGMWLDQDGNGTPDDISWFPTTALTTGAWGAGAIATTPEDLALWAKKLYGTNEVLKDNSLEEMVAPSSLNESYGLGTSMFEYNSCTMTGHSGSIIHQTIMYYSKESDFSIVLMYNGGEYDFSGLLTMLDQIKEALKTVGSNDIVEIRDVNFFPNPFESDLFFTFGLDKNSKVVLELFDEDGKLIKELINQNLLEGRHEYNWNGSFFSSLKSGVYHYKFLINDELITGSLVKI